MRRVWIMACTVAAVLLIAIGCAGMVSADTSGGLNSRIDMQKKYAGDFYSEGMYKIGTDMPAGEYMIFTSSGSGYFCRSADSNQNNIIENDSIGIYLVDF